MQLLKTERFSATHEVMGELAGWNRFSEHPVSSAIGSRVIAVIVTPFFSAMDVLIHATLASIKTCTGLVLTPYNFVVLCICPECDPQYLASEEWGLGSAVLHLVIVVKSVVFMPVVMITAAFSPELGGKNADPASIFGPQGGLITSLQQDLASLGY